MNRLTGLFRRCAVAVRHLPGLRRFDALWDRLRQPYLRILDEGGKGVAYNVGGTIVRVPLAHAAVNWDAMEREAMRRFVDWVRSQDQPLVVDVGCANGIYSLAAVATTPDAEVLAIDSNLPSLVATQEMVALTAPSRVRFVHGMIADRTGTSEGYLAAASATKAAMEGVSRGAIHYVNLGDPEAQHVPTRTLDSLLADVTQARPILIKIDIEGAEFAALCGMADVLTRRTVTLLLSVHPALLERYGKSEGDVRTLLSRAGFRITVLEVDHEAHWWCERSSEPSREAYG